MADPDYFTDAEFRGLPDMSDTQVYTAAQVLAAAAYFTAIVEREVFGETGEGFVPRSLTETFDGDGSLALVLRTMNVRSLTSVTVGGVTVSVGGLTGVGGSLRYLDGGTGWGRGVANIVVTYSAGRYDECPPDVKDAVMQATRDRLLAQNDQSGVDIRRTSVTTDYGTTSYVLPGENRPTGYPDLDAVIASYKRSVPSIGFA